MTSHIDAGDLDRVAKKICDQLDSSTKVISMRDDGAPFMINITQATLRVSARLEELNALIEQLIDIARDVRERTTPAPPQTAAPTQSTPPANDDASTPPSA